MTRQSLYLRTVLLLSLGGCYTPPVENSLAGNSETTVRQELVQPHHEFAGHYGNPPLVFTQMFSAQIKTSVFQKSGGDVYVSFEKQKGVWVVICNSWLPKGAVF